MKGLFITFEGSEGSGKSTQINLIHEYLKKKKKKVLLLREPGGVDISERIREILLSVKNKKMCDECETLLYMAARAQLVAEKIEPALKKGMVVLCDRFLDSTIVYQGYGRGIDISFINAVGKFVTRNIEPDITFFFDIEAKEGLARIARAKDRIEQRPLEYHNRVRAGYLELYKKDPKRIKLIAGNKSREEISDVVRQYVEKIL